MTMKSIVATQSEEGNKTYFIRDLGLLQLTEFLHDTSRIKEAADPVFLAPELFEEIPPSLRSDIYSIGHILYACMLGGHPFGGKGWDECARRHNEGLPDAREYNSSLPESLVCWIASLTKPVIEDRPHSVEIARKLMPDAMALKTTSPPAVIGLKPVPASPPPPTDPHGVKIVTLSPSHEKANRALFVPSSNQNIVNARQTIATAPDTSVAGMLSTLPPHLRNQDDKEDEVEVIYSRSRSFSLKKLLTVVVLILTISFAVKQLRSMKLDELIGFETRRESIEKTNRQLNITPKKRENSPQEKDPKDTSSIAEKTSDPSNKNDLAIGKLVGISMAKVKMLQKFSFSDGPPANTDGWELSVSDHQSAADDGWEFKSVEGSQPALHGALGEERSLLIQNGWKLDYKVKVIEGKHKVAWHLVETSGDKPSFHSMVLLIKKEDNIIHLSDRLQKNVYQLDSSQNEWLEFTAVGLPNSDSYGVFIGEDLVFEANMDVNTIRIHPHDRNKLLVMPEFFKNDSNCHWIVEKLSLGFVAPKDESKDQDHSETSKTSNDSSADNLATAEQ
jgi:serine/threonine protein kinase